MNKKGFALTETLVVVVFLVTIFTFVYVSILPLIGKYEGIIDSEQEINTVYKLYNIRKLIMSDDNRKTVTATNGQVITCSMLNYETLCNKMMEQLNLSSAGTDNYVLVYVNPVDNYLSDITNGEIKSFLERRRNEINKRSLILLDKSEEQHTLAYLFYDDAI